MCIKNRKKSHAVSKEVVLEAYQKFVKKMRDKGFDKDHINEEITEQRFLELASNPYTGNFEEKRIIEAMGGLQGELEGFYTECQNWV